MNDNRTGSVRPTMLSRRNALRLAAAAAPLVALGASSMPAWASARTQPVRAAATTTGAGVSVINALAYNSDERPTGETYFPIEDLGVGNNIQAALNKVAKLAAAPTLTLPAGVFEAIGFSQSADYIGILIPPNVSLIGSGRDTILRVRPDTVTAAQVQRWVPPTYPLGTTNGLQVIRAARGSIPITLSNFTVDGTVQRPAGSSTKTLYNGLVLANCPSPTLSNLLVRGIPGNLNSPPGETFSINILGGSGASFYNVEVDGRDAVTGTKIAGCGVGINSTSNVVMYDCNLHDMGYSHGISFWQSTDVTTYNLRSEFNGVGRENGGGGGTSGTGINSEKSRNTVHFAPRLGGNSLSSMRYWGSPLSSTDARSGDTGGHRVVNAVLTDGKPFVVRLDRAQATRPLLTSCPTPVWDRRP
ncbi:hypothetical protein [Nakamurella endophytica]|uniref:Uncharacterized protein n=1 Tax=Nakamurella endophytica TaxID=1748367 RepID=A0A917SLY3_9ACTN|nr:hypothetical protein [Nakamurella endophytica]GGL87357.1 hypothetical protein GCM10011594_03670 [Nakamurella endophytica]